MKYTLLFVFTVLLLACTESLNVQPASELSDSFVQTSKGATAILNSVYSAGLFNADQGVNRIYAEEAPTDVLVNYRGFLNINVLPMQSFAWLPSSGFFGDFYSRNFTTVRNANIFLDAVGTNPELTPAQKATMTAEARYLRALAYFYMYGWFGPVALITKPFASATDDFQIPRATEAEITAFIETELLASAKDLPVKVSLTGLATQGAALGVLTKFYMMTKQWDKAATTAKQIIDGNQYKLWPDYATLFAIANKGNSEMIFVYPSIAKSGFGNVWTANALPPQYPTPVFNTATQVCVPVAFYNTFSSTDTRRSLLLSSYTTPAGQFIDLTTGVEYQNPRSLKYPIDPNAADRHHADDFPLIRYADILLCRAEALVMVSGTVGAEALGLLNQIRTRAGLTALTNAQVPDKTTFISAIIRERGWEFYSEGKRREDLIRQDMFITNAISRGQPAKPYQTRFPLPQTEVDANPTLVQNPGY